MKSLQMTVIMQNLCLMQKPIWLFYAQKEEARLPPAFNSTDLLVPNRRARFFCLTMQCMIQRVGIESRVRLTLPYILPDFIYIAISNWSCVETKDRKNSCSNRWVR